MAEHTNPFPGQKTRMVLNWGDSSSESPIEEIRPEEADLDMADIVTSEMASRDGSRHKIVLDIDHPIVVLNSTTPGHHHLFIDKELGWGEYLEVIRVLVKVGIVEEGYLGASAHRGFTGVRLPWIVKPQAITPICARCNKVPSEIGEYISMGREEGVHPDVFVRENEGTYNTRTGRFWCTECYIALGQPLGTA